MWAAIAAGLILVVVAGAVALSLRQDGKATNEAPASTAPASRPSDPEEVRKQFKALQSHFEETVIDHHCSLGDPLYLSARDLSDTLPERSEDGARMKRELDDMRRICQATESNGPESEAIIAGLRQKHLAYTQR